MPAGPHQTLLASVADKGSRLREVRKDLLRQLPGQTQRWFQGPSGCDLFLWYDDEKGLSQVQLTFEERVVEWSPAEGVRTGRLHFDRSPEADTLTLARVLLESATVDDLTLMLIRKTLGLRG